MVARLFAEERMTADEWEASTDALAMVRAACERPADPDALGRRLRDYYLACGRDAWPFLVDGWRRAVEVAERWRDGRATDRERTLARWAMESRVFFDEDGGPAGPRAAALARAADALSPADRRALLHTAEGRALGGRELVLRAADFADFAICAGPTRQAPPAESLAAFMSPDLLRCVFANPLRPPRMLPAWRTADVVGLALGIDADGAFDRLPLLADALMDAGCDDENLLAHARMGGHVRGCWLVDLIQGRE